MDLILIRRCQAGDEQAFGLLYEEYKNLVFRTACLTLGSAVDAEDILQDVFLQVHRSLDSYDPSRGAFSTWLYRMTINRCLNSRRSSRSLRRLEDIAGSDPGSINSLVDRLEDDDCVRRALGRLSDKLRAMVILRYYFGFSYGEIADILEMPLGTVKSRLNQALRSMRDSLEPDSSTSACVVAGVQK
jgi:RNA polymerase sigma-70 factor, ECF subfamily